MDELREQLKNIIDHITGVLDWIDRVIPGFIRHRIPILARLDEINAALKVIRFLITFGGDSYQLRMAAARLKQLTSELTQFSDTTVVVSNLAATDPNVWTDVNASPAYVQRITDQAGYFGNAETWVQALGDAVDADAAVIDEFYSKLFSTGMEMLGAVATIVAGASTIASAVVTLGASLAPGIATLVGGFISLIDAIHSAIELANMEAPTISPTAEGQAWPVPVLW